MKIKAIPKKDLFEKELTKFSSTPIILIGDTHGYLDDFKIQKEVIGKSKPDYVLYESLENQELTKPKDFDNILKKEKISEMTKVKEVRELVLLCRKKRIPIIGIDYRHFGIKNPKKFKGKIDSKAEFTKKEQIEIGRLCDKREQKQLSMIKKYAKKGRIVVITGAYHLRKRSLLMRGLKNFLVVYPAYKGKLIFSPITKKSEIKYKFAMVYS